MKYLKNNEISIKTNEISKDNPMKYKKNNQICLGHRSNISKTPIKYLKESYEISQGIS